MLQTFSQGGMGMCRFIVDIFLTLLFSNEWIYIYAQMINCCFSLVTHVTKFKYEKKARVYIDMF
jgi:hypothetical protein